jgi:hypothetical protein
MDEPEARLGAAGHVTVTSGGNSSSERQWAGAPSAWAIERGL